MVWRNVVPQPAVMVSVVVRRADIALIRGDLGQGVTEDLVNYIAGITSLRAHNAAFL